MGRVIAFFFGFLLMPFMMLAYTCIAPWYEKLLQAGPRKWWLLGLASIVVGPFMGLAYIGGMIWEKIG